jgi:methyl-accepting chemotaxis protein
MLKQTEVMNQVMSKRLIDVNQISEKINNDVGTAVRCLQFEDMTTQLLEYITRRVEQIRIASNDFNQAITGFISSKHADDSMRYHEQALQAVSQMNQSLNRAVSQSSIDEGGIDLF